MRAVWSWQLFGHRREPGLQTVRCGPVQRQGSADRMRLLCKHGGAAVSELSRATLMRHLWSGVKALERCRCVCVRGSLSNGKVSLPWRTNIDTLREDSRSVRICTCCLTIVCRLRVFNTGILFSHTRTLLPLLLDTANSLSVPTVLQVNTLLRSGRPPWKIVGTAPLVLGRKPKGHRPSQPVRDVQLGKGAKSQDRPR